MTTRHFTVRKWVGPFPDSMEPIGHFNCVEDVVDVIKGPEDYLYSVEERNGPGDFPDSWFISKLNGEDWLVKEMVNL